MKKEHIFLTAFCFILAIPLLFSDKVGGKISEAENRYLAPFPALTLHAGIKSELEDWINDNAGGRNFLKTLYNDLDVNVLKTHYDGTNFYQDDWVFLMNDAVTHRYLMHQETMGPDQQDSWVSAYKTVQDFLLQKNISMCSVIFPHKSEIYEDQFKDLIIPVSEKGPADSFKEIEKEHPELHLRVLYDIFAIKTNEGEPLYPKAYDSSHWNNQGAWLGYQELMKTIQEKCPGVQPLTEDDVTVSACELLKVYNGKKYSENDLEYLVKNPSAAEDPSWFTSIGYSSSDQWKSYRYYKNAEEDLPKILIIGDSYVWMFLLPWISESFSETVFIHQSDSGNLQQMLDVLDPDIVAFAGLENTVENAIKQIASAVH